MLQAKLLNNNDLSAYFHNSFKNAGFANAADWAAYGGSCLAEGGMLLVDGAGSGIAVCAYQQVYTAAAPRQLYLRCELYVDSLSEAVKALPASTNNRWAAIGNGLYPRYDVTGGKQIPEEGGHYLLSGKAVTSAQIFSFGVGAVTSVDMAGTRLRISRPLLIDLVKYGMEEWTKEQLDTLPWKE